MRRRLRSGDTLSYHDLHDFAGSILSLDDVARLKHFMSVGNRSETAADAATLLFTHGGVGNLNSLIRDWFEAGDCDSEMADAAPVILASCVRQLYDGTALRVLFEFADIYGVNLVLKQIIDDFDEPSLNRLLHQRVSEQLDALIEARGRDPSNRFVWTLRTYGQHASVRNYLYSLASAGRVAALGSYAMHDERVPWSLIRAARPEDDFDTRLVVNIALENIARGAEWRDLDAQAFFGKLSPKAKAEFRDGYSSLMNRPESKS